PRRYTRHKWERHGILPSQAFVGWFLLWCPRDLPNFAELARQLFERRPAVEGAIDFAVDAIGVNQIGIGRMEAEVPNRAISSPGHLRAAPGRPAVRRA